MNTIVSTEFLEGVAATLGELKTAIGADSISEKAMSILDAETQSLIDDLYNLINQGPTPEVASAPSEPKRTLIDTINGHTRHKAIIHDGWALTECKKGIVHFWDAIHYDGMRTSYFYTDGTYWAKPCKHCLPNDHAAMKNGELQGHGSES